MVLCSLTLASSLPASTTAYWRLEEGINGSDVTAAVDSSGNGFGQSSRSGTPKYSNNVPGAYIFDPVSGLTSPCSSQWQREYPADLPCADSFVYRRKAIRSSQGDSELGILWSQMAGAERFVRSFTSYSPKSRVSYLCSLTTWNLLLAGRSRKPGFGGIHGANVCK